jgi:hypothetical protein
MCDFVSTLLSTFFGAILAFVFGLVIYHIQKSQENMSYLHYTVSVLGQLSSHLYSFKEQIAKKRYDEAMTQLKTLQEGVEEQNKKKLRIQENLNFMYGAEFQLAMDIQKLAFIAKGEPNLIILLGTLVDSVKSLNHITSNINNDIEKYSSGSSSLDLIKIKLLLEKNILLYEQLDTTLYLTEKGNDFVIKFGQREYNRKMKIKSLEVLDKYRDLKPKPIKSWEDYNLSPKKKHWWN